jgi:hypothetical protein
MKEFYLARLQDGWSMRDIDDCDFYYWLELCNYSVESEKVTIDQAF